jgi:hypothetical protein
VRIKARVQLLYLSRGEHEFANEPLVYLQIVGDYSMSPGSALTAEAIDPPHLMIVYLVIDYPGIWENLSQGWVYRPKQ